MWRLTTMFSSRMKSKRKRENLLATINWFSLSGHLLELANEVFPPINVWCAFKHIRYIYRKHTRDNVIIRLSYSFHKTKKFIDMYMENILLVACLKSGKMNSFSLIMIHTRWIDDATENQLTNVKSKYDISKEINK